MGGRKVLFLAAARHLIPSHTTFSRAVTKYTATVTESLTGEGVNGIEQCAGDSIIGSIHSVTPPKVRKLTARGCVVILLLSHDDDARQSRFICSQRPPQAGALVFAFSAQHRFQQRSRETAWNGDQTKEKRRERKADDPTYHRRQYI